MVKRSTATSTHASSDGFTLVEVTLVILIVGILLSIVVPRLSILGEETLDSGARRVATLISYLHDEAALRGRIYKLTFDLDQAGYRVEVQTPYAAGAAAEDFGQRWDPYAKGGALPPGVTVQRVATADAVHTSGAAEIYFLPENALEDVTITLAGESGRLVELGVDGLTGRVEITEAEDRS